MTPPLYSLPSFQDHQQVVDFVFSSLFTHLPTLNFLYYLETNYEQLFDINFKNLVAFSPLILVLGLNPALILNFVSST